MIPDSRPARNMAGSSRGGAGRRRSRGGAKKGGGGPAKRQPTLTSLPTGRAAYTETRRWLLEQHGPVCAYCERTVAERTITLDHVTPRRGLTAYDRRDNLVLSCRPCNASKADKPILAFLLSSRTRVVALYKHGQHLSHQLVEMVKDLLPPDERPALTVRAALPKGAKRRKTSRELFGEDHGPSPYLDG